MKRSIYLGLIVLFVCGLSACDSYNYYQAALNKTNMSGYHTFAWMPGPKNNASQQADAAIKTSTTTALQSKGLALQQQKPDLLVSYTVTVGRGTRTNYYYGYPGWYGGPYWGWGGGFGWGWGWGWGDPFMYGPGFGPDVHSYTVYTSELDLEIDRMRVFLGLSS